MNPLSPGKLLLILIFLSLATLMLVLDYSVANVAIPYISGDLGVSNNQGSWLITSFAVGNAIVLALSGYLAERFGTVRTVVFSILSFVFFSWACGASTDFMMLVICRFLQGASGGSIVPLSQTLILQNYPEKKHSLAISTFLMIAFMGPVLGPLLGGWIAEDYEWPWIFYVNIPLGLAAAGVVWKILGHRDSEQHKKKIDFLGIACFVIGISSLQILLDKGDQWDWFDSSFIRILAAVSFLFLSFTILWELSIPHPFVKLRLFISRNLSLGTFLVSVTYMLYFGTLVITSLWLQSYMSYTALWAGAALAPIGIIPVFLCIPLARFLNRFPKEGVLLAFFLFLITFFICTLLTPQSDFQMIALTRFLLGFPYSLFFAAATLLSMQDIQKTQLPKAMGLFHFCRAFSGGAGTSLTLYLWNRRTIFHHFHLIEKIQTEPVIFKEEGLLKKQLLNQAVDIQASLLAINDIFWAYCLILGGLFFLSFLMRNKKREKPQEKIISPVD
jgi:MFS transporter, DHA2 family, multidrug resistance protein